MKLKLIAGNWKMNGSLSANEALVHGVQLGLMQALSGKQALVAVCVGIALVNRPAPKT
jgi:triosephosphate isomerase